MRGKQQRKTFASTRAVHDNTSVIQPLSDVLKGWCTHLQPPWLTSDCILQQCLAHTPQPRTAHPYCTHAVTYRTNTLLLLCDPPCPPTYL